jgi:predicted nucleic acid-binding protein
VKKVVVDASVAVKWFIPEIHAQSALNLLATDMVLMAPDLICAEVGNVFWKKHLRDEIAAEYLSLMLKDLAEIPVRLYPFMGLLSRAWTIAVRHKRSYYDSLYLALAQIQDCLLVTADRKLYEAMKDSSLGESIRWVEEVG